MSFALVTQLSDPPSSWAVADVPTVINNLRNWIVGLLAGLATLFLTFGGLRYLMAGGDPGEVESAKRALKAAAIGYGLAIMAPVLVTVLQGIVGAGGGAANDLFPPRHWRPAPALRLPGVRSRAAVFPVRPGGPTPCTGHAGRSGTSSRARDRTRSASDARAA
ncbi:pilin [Streptomyces aureus]